MPLSPVIQLGLGAAAALVIAGLASMSVPARMKPLTAWASEIEARRSAEHRKTIQQATSSGPAMVAALNIYPTPSTYVPPSAVVGTTSEGYAYWKAVRQAVGIRDFTVSAQLEAAGRNHSEFLRVNGYAYGHKEAAGLPGFTGVTLCDRQRAAGSTDPCYSEDIAPAYSAFQAVELLIDAPYHRFGLLSDAFESGGMGSSALIPPTYGFFSTFDMAKVRSTPNQIIVYPQPNAVDVPTAWRVEEIPSPMGEYDDKFVGYPITFAGPDFKPLTMSDVTVTDKKGQLVIGRLIHDYANTRIAMVDRAVWISYSPFKPGTKYTVDAVGSINGQGVVLSWSFTTTAKPLAVSVSNSQLTPNSQSIVEIVGGSGRGWIATSGLPNGVTMQYLSQRKVLLTRSSAACSSINCYVQIYAQDFDHPALDVSARVLTP